MKSHLLLFVLIPGCALAEWKKHEVFQGERCNTAVAGDFTGDGKIDIIAHSGRKARLFTQGKTIVLEQEQGLNAIHSECFDVDGDGDLDYIGAQYKPGRVFWLEQPEKPLEQPWTFRLVTDRLSGIHGLLKADVDGDGKMDLLANSGQPDGDHPESMAWLKVPASVRAATSWDLYVIADKDAPALSHYMGFGDVNGDGRPDVSLGAKGTPPRDRKDAYFAWWEAPKDLTQPWTRHWVAQNQPGATCIMPADVNGDGKTDFIATRGHDYGVLWYESPGTGAPDWIERPIHPKLHDPHCLQVLDLDGDGDTDAASCGYSSKEVWWFENDGKGTFTNHLVARDQAAYDLRAIDMDGDGDIDLLVAGQQSQNVAWYENPER